jgi:hypothetical protein
MHNQVNEIDDYPSRSFVTIRIKAGITKLFAKLGELVCDGTHLTITCPCGYQYLITNMTQPTHVQKAHVLAATVCKKLSYLYRERLQ